MGREEGTPLRNTAEDSKTNYGTARDLSYFIDPDSGDEEDNLYHISYVSSFSSNFHPFIPLSILY